STSLGITALMTLIFGLIPWYQALKRSREYRHWTAADIAKVLPVLRFETWLDQQKAPCTRFLLICIAAVGAAQVIFKNSLVSAGMIKPLYFAGEWWRIFTAPMLHGNIVHFLMNAAALIYLGKRVEVFARWPHVPLVFLFSACVGGEASARFLDAPSVGASGGLMGWLGFLLVFEWLHSRLVPRAATRRLLAGVALTALIGVVGFRYIDNAAHAGGLLAGIAYAAIVFPKSAAPHRPRSTWPDRLAGSLALLAILGITAFTILRIAQA
ncbi:MAG: rhomboid family intramembrane serine protease, partial [Luteolibacter sp.]